MSHLLNRGNGIINHRFESEIEDLSSICSSDTFVDPVEVQGLLQRYSKTRKEAESTSKRFLVHLLDRKLLEQCRTFIQVYDGLEETAHAHNQGIAWSLIPGIKASLGDIDGHQLDDQQLTAIAMDVNTRLIIAGAGTGKTTTIIGLVKHLLQSGKASPEEILVLSFTNATVADLSSRIQDATGVRDDVCTFHRLGMRILASCDGKVPLAFRGDLPTFVRDRILELVSDRSYLRDLDNYLNFDSRYQADENDFSDKSDYERYISENPLYTLDGRAVKSFGEADIANWLITHGIRFEYESPYPIDTRTSEYGQYHPDFHISGTDVYIEYFGIDRDGSVAPFMRSNHGDDPSEEYRKGMDWKVAIHRGNGTRLISLYSYQRSEGTLLDDLESALKDANIPIRERDATVTLSKLMETDSIILDRVSHEFSTAITLVKGRGQGFDLTSLQGSNRRERKLLQRARRLIEPIYDAYQDNLRRNGEIDFEDMLNLAAERVSSGRYQHGLKYVIVDEYQDMSHSRYNLLRALRESGRFKLFCVGDDWQSIYRFNGSDVGYILDFERYWGPSEILRIERTYRFSGQLLRISNAFMNSAPNQIHKELVGDPRSDSAFRIITGKRGICARRVSEIVADIPTDESILMLGRFRHDVVFLDGGGFQWRPNADGRTISVISARDPTRRITFMTIHGSKGIQADHVFVLNNRKGSGGFPDTRGESVLIRSLLEGSSSKMDDERRLFYVAITRARKAAYLVAPEGEESVFVKECRELSHIATEPFGAGQASRVLGRGG